jgi:hypothetical protein
MGPGETISEACSTIRFSSTRICSSRVPWIRFCANRARLHHATLRRVTPEELALLQQQLYALQAENHALRQELQRIAAQQQAAADRRAQVLRGGGRLLIPLLDRHKVVRSFGKLVETTGAFTGPREQWPTREQVLGDARLFLESVVRFMVRRRTLLLVFALLGAVIPAIQIWLVVQQNEIIGKQTTIIEEQRKHSEIQVFDVVSRSMTEGDRNARLMTSALLSRSDPGFLAGVIDEAFDPELAGVHRTETLHAATRRLEDTAFRGHLIRAAVRGIHRRLVAAPEAELAAVAEQSRPVLHRIMQDAELRVPEVLKIGEDGGATDGALDEQIDGYLTQVGSAMRLYARLARTQGQTQPMFDDLRYLLQRVDWAQLPRSRFAAPLASAMQELLVELALEPGPRDALTTDWTTAGLAPADAYAKGQAALRTAVGDANVKWDAFTTQVGS